MWTCCGGIRSPLTLRLRPVLPAGPAQVWQLNAQNVLARLPDVPVQTGQITIVLPPQSISLFLIPERPHAPGAEGR